MNWLVDNAGALYVLCAIIAAALVAIWWSNRRLAYLYGAVGAVALLGLTWWLANFVPSDRRQIEENVHAMKDAVKDGKPDDLFKHVSKDFKYKEITRDQLRVAVAGLTRTYKVRDIRITKFKVDFAQDGKLARASFRVSAWAKDHDQPYLFAVEADFVREGERWMLKTMRFYNLVNQDQEVEWPLLP